MNLSDTPPPLNFLLLISICYNCNYPTRLSLEHFRPLHTRLHKTCALRRLSRHFLIWYSTKSRFLFHFPIGHKYFPYTIIGHCEKYRKIKEKEKRKKKEKKRKKGKKGKKPSRHNTIELIIQSQMSTYNSSFARW